MARCEVLIALMLGPVEGCSIRNLAERLQLHGTSVTSLVDLLEEQGLARRCENPSDGRGVLVRATQEGLRRAKRGALLLNAQLFTDMGLPEADMRRLWEILRTLRRGAGDFC